MKRIVYTLILPIVVLSCLAFTSLKTGSKFDHDQPNNSLSADLDSLNSQFYSRTHIRNEDGKTRDRITFKLLDGWSANADIDTDQKFGVYIDGSFFTESDIKKLPVERTAVLTYDHCEGIKPEQIPKGDHYAIPFCFVTKTKK